MVVGADPASTGIADSTHAIGRREIWRSHFRRAGRRGQHARAVLVGAAARWAILALTIQRIADLIGGQAQRTPLEPAVALNVAAGLEAQGFDGRLECVEGIGGAQIAERPGGVAGAVGVREALLAKVLIPGDARVEIAP
jgi:hypothetical protein